MFKGGLGEMLQQASRFKEDILAAQAELAKKTVEATAGGGMVKVTANGKGEVVSIAIDPKVLEMGDRDLLQDLVKAGVNQALQASQRLAGDEMGKLTAGLGPLASMLKGFGGG